jgi:hypothetical protein
MGGCAAGGCAPAVPSVDDSPAPTPDAAVAMAEPVFDAAPQAPAGRDASPEGGLPVDAARPDLGTSDGRSPDERADVAPSDAAFGGDAARDALADGTADATADGPTARVPKPGEVRIDELLVDPAGDDLGHEWLEIVNLAPVPVDLATLHVSDGTTDSAVAAGVMAPGALLVLGQSLDRAHNGDAPVDLTYGTKLALNNGADRIAVCLGACAGGDTLDALAWTTAWGAAYVGHAVVVDPKTGSTCPAAKAYGKGGNYGSPGQANPPCPSGG